MGVGGQRKAQAALSMGKTWYPLYFIHIFDIRLIPTLFLILGWEYQPERVQAGIY
jgi:hypothetical protein